MKRSYFFLLAVFCWTASVLTAQVSINTATAWYNNDDFESYTLGGTESGWNSHGSITARYLQKTSDGDKLLAFAQEDANNLLTEGSQGGDRTVFKTYSNQLSGAVYVKTDVYHGAAGATYTLKNTVGDAVFEFGISSGNSNAVSFTGETNAEAAYGARRTWITFEFVLDLINNKLVKIDLDNGAKTFTNLDLLAGGNINSFQVKMLKGYMCSGFDNITIAELVPNALKNLTGDSEFQTLSGNVEKTYSVTSYATAIDIDVAIPSSSITWEISSYGALSSADQAFVSLTANPSNANEAVLKTTDVISADATITLKATLNGVELTKNIELKAASTAALKETLQAEIVTASALDDGITDSNPYLTGIINTLNGAISTAQNVYDNSGSSVEDIAQAIFDLQTAEATFTSALAVYTDFTAYIVTVQTAHDAETRTAPFFATVKNTLQTAVNTATGARTTVASAGDINGAKTALTSALTAFNDALPHYSALETAITVAQNKYTLATPREGSGFLNYRSDDLTALNGAISTANSALASVETVEALDNAKSAVEGALATFNNAGRVAPSITNSYKIYTYGVDNGDGNTDKKVLFADGTTLKYALATSEISNNEWLIVETATNTYSIQNKTSQLYLSNNALQEESVTITLPENKSQTGLINQTDDSYFFYAIVGTRVLEVDAWDSEASTGMFVNFNGIAPERMRYCFQFEENGPLTSDKTISGQSDIKIWIVGGYLCLHAAKSQKIKVYSAVGQLVWQSALSEGLTKLPISKGLYIVVDEAGTSTKVVNK